MSNYLDALKGINAVVSYAMMVGIILSVLIGLNATKIITEKKLEFFRESQSGVSVSAYYLAANITSTFEQGCAAIAGSVLAYLILVPSTSFLVYLWNFFMLSWLSVSWALLLSILVPLNSVSTVGTSVISIIIIVAVWQRRRGELFVQPIFD